MPKEHDNPSAGTFPYRYELSFVNKDPEATTAVYLPGGPGGGSIGETARFQENFPTMNLVLIDPRGVGCNFQGPDGFKLRQLSTEEHARDVLDVIKQLKLKNFIIYGISYGTVVGTKVALPVSFWC